MSVGVRRPFEAVDYQELVRAFPPPPEYFERAWLAPPEEIERVQLSRLRERALAAAQVPFFARRWEAAGFDARTLIGLGDLERVSRRTRSTTSGRASTRIRHGGTTRR